MQRLTANPWVVCLVASGFLFFQFFQISNFNVLIPDLIVAFHTDTATLSMISALYFYGTIIFLVPAGVILDHLSTRMIILLAMSASLFGLFLFTIAETSCLAGFGRLLIGLSGGPFGFISCMRLASRWFPPERLGSITGVIVSSAMFAGVISQTPFVLLIDMINWRNAMWINLGFGLVILSLVYLFVYDYPLNKKEEYLKQIEANRREGFIKGLRKVVFSPQNWLAGTFSSLLNLPIFLLGALWGMMYLEHAHNTTRFQASVICSFLFVGMLIGAPFFGFISDRIKLRKIVMLIGAVICLCATLFVIEVDQLSYLVLILAFFAIGFGASGQSIAYPYVTETNPPAVSGAVLGLVSTLIMAGGAIEQPVFAWMVQMGPSEIINGIPHYMVDSYKLAMWTMPLAILLSILMITFLRETHCRAKD